MFKLGFLVFASVMFFYAACEYHRQANKRRLLEWISISSIDEFRTQNKTPLELVTSIFSKLFGFVFPKGMAAQNVRERLNWAGYTHVEVESYFTIRLLLFFIPMLVYSLMLRETDFSTLYGSGAGLVLFMLPEYFLNYKLNRRNSSIEKELLPLTELLVTSTEAGLNIEQAIQRITKIKGGHFSSILRQGYQYMDGILTREDAFEWMKKQTNVESVHLFIEAIAMSEKHGTTISHILREQLNRIRNEIQNTGIARAQAINGKMMLPTAILIFIPLLIMILGPQILALRSL